nr:Concanavalin A-like lectin/glucanases superfamily [uncultured bacterium]
MVWEARDQEPVIAAELAFVPKSVGEQWVEAEAMWPDGRRAFAKAIVNAGASLKIAANRFQALSVKTSPDTVAVYHLDNTLADTTGRSPAFKLGGNAKFDTSNLSWMSQRQGAALRFQDINDKAYASIDLTKLGPASEISIEAMFYLNTFKAYNRTNGNIVSLQEDWNSALQLLENIYEGPMVRGGTEFSLKKDELAQAITPSEWHHINLSINSDGYSFRVDGKVIKSLRSAELANWCRKPATLEIGNFDGYIDEVVIKCARAKAAKKYCS